MPDQIDARYQFAMWLRDQCEAILAPPPRCIAVFGAFAGGDMQNSPNDIDVLLIGNDIPKDPQARKSWFHPFKVNFETEHQKTFPNIKRTLAPIFVSEQEWLNDKMMRLLLSQQSWILRDDGFLNRSLEETRGGPDAS